MGGTAEPVLRRAARLADGWLPQSDPGSALDDRLHRLQGYLKEEGRDPGNFEIVGRMNLKSPDADDWAERVHAWREAGATHLSIDTMGIGLDAPVGHATVIGRFADAMADAGVHLNT